jgi:hypothetical protein
VTVYPVIAKPPLFPVYVNVTTACVSPGVAIPIIGASGTVAGIIELLVDDEMLFPFILVATTVNV